MSHYHLSTVSVTAMQAKRRCRSLAMKKNKCIRVQQRNLCSILAIPDRPDMVSTGQSLAISRVVTSQQNSYRRCIPKSSWKLLMVTIKRFNSWLFTNNATGCPEVGYFRTVERWFPSVAVLGAHMISKQRRGHVTTTGWSHDAKLQDKPLARPAAPG